jgi:hypothetical protein
MNMNEQQIEMKAEDILSRYNNVEWSGEGDSLYTANQMFHAIVTALKEGAAPVGEAPKEKEWYDGGDWILTRLHEKRVKELAAEVERLKGEGEAPKWIPVSERLPEEIERRYSVRVLCCTDSGYITQGYLMNGDWMYDARSVKFKDYGYIVTHWMPLPPKPSSNA